jgi:hypothetical protein
MAGAGYKLFATGDVLTAAQVNTYLMQQTVMVFASSAARTSALSGVLAEGMVSYLQDTNTLEVYDGAAWVGATGDITGLTAGTGISISSATGPVPTVAIDTAVTADLTTAQTLTNKTLTSPVLTTPSISNINAKGDILVGTADNTLGIITAGSNGETLVADSSTSTGLRYQGHIEAGKNFIINGGFDIWQRGTTSTSAAAYGTADRWYQLIESGSGTWAQETTVVPTGSTYSLKFTASATSSIYPIQAIESLNATRLAGQRVTFSGQVAASTSTAMSMVVSHSSSTDVAPGGSWTNLTAVSGGTATPTSTTFVPISGVYDIPSTAKSIRVIIRTTSTIASGVVVYWGNLQLELGSVATTFSRAGGTIQGELAACQRYYWRTQNAAAFTSHGNGFGETTTVGAINIVYPITMRVAPTSLDYANLALIDSGGALAVTSASLVHISALIAKINATVASGVTVNRPYFLINNNNTAGYVGFSAEL